MNSPAIKVDHVSKRFARSLKKVMWYGLCDIARTVLIPARYRSPDWTLRTSELGAVVPAPADIQGAPLPLRPSEFWALQDVSFEVQRGECVGLIGANGAGKSTLFKILSGILAPTAGQVHICGRLTALIEVGSGFHPMLSGRENIYISGAILGMSKREIDEKYDAIVEFSGVGEFIDMPIKFYSSGMHVRLGFAVLAHLNPEVMLIDEILAVGDMNFQRKCIERINQMRASNMAIALVSHSLYRIESLCSKVVWLEKGQVKLQGVAKEVVCAYREHEMKRSEMAPHSRLPKEQDVLDIRSVEVLTMQDEVAVSLPYGEDFKVRIRYVAHKPIRQPRFHLSFIAESFPVFQASMLLDGQSPSLIAGEGEIVCRIRQPRLLPKRFEVELFVNSEEGAVHIVDPYRASTFAVSYDRTDVIPQAGPYALNLLARGGLVYYDYEWDLSRAQLHEKDEC